MNSKILAGIKKTVESFFTEYCDIYKPNDSISAYRTIEPGWSHVGNYPCRMITYSLRSNSDRMIAMQESQIDSYKMILPVGTPVTTGYRILYDGNYYDFIYFNQFLTDKTHVEIAVKLVRDGETSIDAS